MKPKVSIITATYNSADCIERCITSVLEQTYPDIEHIFVDAVSTDGTTEMINSLAPGANLISEPDSGIYDAFNKGLQRATGDIILFLNSDDQLIGPNVVSSAVIKICDANVDMLFSSVNIISLNGRTTRHYKAVPVTVKSLEMGAMPPHTGAFIMKKVYNEIGKFNTEFKISGDYEWFCRAASHKIFSQKVDRNFVTVEMAGGGASSRNLFARWIAHNENLRGLRDNNLRASHLLLLTRYFRKILQYRFH